MARTLRPKTVKAVVEGSGTDELRKLAAQKLSQEKAGQTLLATALVREAYLRLVGKDQDNQMPVLVGHSS